VTSRPPFIVLGSIDHGDHDRVIRLLSPELGRMVAYARGLRSSRSRLASALEPGTVVALELKRGKGPMPLIADAHPLSAPKRSREDLDRLGLLAYGIEVCGALAPEHHEAERLFKLLTHWLALVEGPELPGVASRQALEGKALTFAGFAPALVLCPVCGERLADPCAFCPSAGGGAHAACAGGPAVDAAALLRLEALRRTPLADTPGVRPATPWGMLADFIEYQLSAPLKARPLIDELQAATAQI